MKEDNFLKGMGGIMIVVGKKYSPEELDIMLGLLQDIQDGPYLQACHNICNGQVQFFPGTNIIAMIREKAERISNPRISGEEAWEQVISVADSKISRKDLDPITMRTFKSLGYEWHTLVTGGGFALPPDKIGFMRRDFIKFYEQFSETEKSGAVPQIESAGGLEGLLVGIGAGEKIGNI